MVTKQKILFPFPATSPCGSLDGSERIHALLLIVTHRSRLTEALTEHTLAHVSREKEAILTRRFCLEMTHNTPTWGNSRKCSQPDLKKNKRH